MSYFIIVLCFFVSLCQGYNILILMPFLGRSHFEAFKPLFETLALNGHNLTLITFSRTLDINENITTIWLGKEDIVHVVSLTETGTIRRFITAPIVMSRMGQDICEYGLKSDEFQRFLRISENDTFDVILAEYFVTECYLGLANKFKAPVIALLTCDFMPWHYGWFGLSSNPAYIPNIFGGFTTPMNFFARLQNTLLQVYTSAWINYFKTVHNDLSKKYIGYETDILHRTSLVLINSHYSLHGAKALTPNIVEVGGLHISNKKVGKLSDDLEDWINDSDSGVIYFSLGSMIKADSFPEESRKAFTKAFAKLRQRVLWKWDNASMPEKPDNVRLAPWFPQFDILCHSNVKLFISHGGLLGTFEAIHCGVPIIVLPQFGDQKHNALALERNGAGVMLHLQSATEEIVTNALQKALSLETLKNAKLLSERFKDRPNSPMEIAIYWVEYLAKQKEVPHMKSLAVDMPFYKYYLIDVVGTLVLSVIIIVFVFSGLCKFILKCITVAGKKVKQKML